LDEDGRPLREDLVERLAALPEDDDAVPVGPILPLVGSPVEVRLRRREPQLEDGIVGALTEAELRIGAEVSEEHHAVQTFRHVDRLRRRRSRPDLEARNARPVKWWSDGVGHGKWGFADPTRSGREKREFADPARSGSQRGRGGQRELEPAKPGGT